MIPTLSPTSKGTRKIKFLIVLVCAIFTFFQIHDHTLKPTFLFYTHAFEEKDKKFTSIEYSRVPRKSTISQGWMGVDVQIYVDRKFFAHCFEFYIGNYIELFFLLLRSLPLQKLLFNAVVRTICIRFLKNADYRRINAVHFRINA